MDHIEEIGKSILGFVSQSADPQVFLIVAAACVGVFVLLVHIGLHDQVVGLDLPGHFDLLRQHQNIHVLSIQILDGQRIITVAGIHGIQHQGAQECFSRSCQRIDLAGLLFQDIIGKRQVRSKGIILAA